MKYFYYSIIAYVSLLSSYRVSALSSEELKDSIIPPTWNGVLSSNTDAQSGEAFLDAILAFIRDSVFAVFAILAIGVFLFIGWRLIMARWNPEEFKKALQSFIYAAVWIFIVAASWAIVRLVAGIDI